MGSIRKIEVWLEESIKIKDNLKQNQIESILTISKILIKCLKRGGKIILFGNGGSAADAQHLAAELVGRFRKTRVSLAAISLVTDTSVITAIGNDYGFDHIFSRQIEAIADCKDVVIGITTSGDSANVINGIRAAKKKGITTIALTGGNGGKVIKVSDYSLIVPTGNTAHIQEAHITIGHIFCELIEEELRNPSMIK